MLGVLLWGSARMLLVEIPEGVHHHSNWAVFINGERVDFSGDRYMEDVAACASDPNNVRPHDRIHMHNSDPDVVHVHHGGATWGHLMTNLGWALGPDFAIADDGRRFFAEDGWKLDFVVNEFETSSVYDRPAGSADRVLISIAADTVDVDLPAMFAQVASNAAEHNLIADPAGCAGAVLERTLWDRIRFAFWAL